MRDDPKKAEWATGPSSYGTKDLTSDAPYWTNSLVYQGSLSLLKQYPVVVHFYTPKENVRSRVSEADSSVGLRKQGDMAEGGGSVLFATDDVDEIRSSSTSSRSEPHWTTVRFGPPASRRESPAPRSGARNLEVGGCGGYGWRQRRPPAEGAGNERRSRGGRGRGAISCTYAKVSPHARNSVASGPNAGGSA